MKRTSSPATQVPFSSVFQESRTFIRSLIWSFGHVFIQQTFMGACAGSWGHASCLPELRLRERLDTGTDSVRRMERARGLEEGQGGGGPPGGGYGRGKVTEAGTPGALGTAAWSGGWNWEERGGGKGTGWLPVHPGKLLKAWAGHPLSFPRIWLTGGGSVARTTRQEAVGGLSRG